MAWRISDHILSGEIDNRIKDRVTGFFELTNGRGRVSLDLEGNTHPDLAGSLIRFVNPRSQSKTEPVSLENFALEQIGLAGDITASHRVKDLLVPLDTFTEMDEATREKAYRWANCLYLEWYGRRNGRVVVEGVGYEMEWVEGPLWEITEEGLRGQGERSQGALLGFFEDVGTAMQTEAALRAEDDGESVPPAEAEMDAEMVRMDLLNDRIERRLAAEGLEEFERIYEEESARLRSERGEPEPLPLTAEEEAAREAWIDEMNADSQEALEEIASEDWKQEQPKTHPLVIECREFSLELRREIILPQGSSREHPLCEIINGVLCAAGKLAGALNGYVGDAAWPPNELRAPTVLVFLKKARGYLSDALRGLDSADEEQLATSEWRETTRVRITNLLDATQQHILEARESLSDEDL